MPGLAFIRWRRWRRRRQAASPDLAHQAGDCFGGQRFIVDDEQRTGPGILDNVADVLTCGDPARESGKQVCPSMQRLKPKARAARQSVMHAHMRLKPMVEGHIARLKRVRRDH
jgi:hypothetical protein